MNIICAMKLCFKFYYAAFFASLAVLAVVLLISAISMLVKRHKRLKIEFGQQKEVNEKDARH